MEQMIAAAVMPPSLPPDADAAWTPTGLKVASVESMPLGDALAVEGRYREWKKGQRERPELRVKHRQRIKDEITQHLHPDRHHWPEVIIRDVARMDEYPEPDDSPWGISPWFKVEVKGTYHRGVEAILRLAKVELSGGLARETEDGSETVAVIGRIPFDVIVHIDWSGDEYNPQPHFYCWFDFKGEPYESVEIYRLPDYMGYWHHLDDVRFKPRKFSRWQQWRAHRRLKKVQRDFDRRARS
jgi:hypothetical protein